MPRREGETTIARSADEVFAFLADGGNNPKWRGAVLEATPEPGPVGVGSIVRQVHRGPGGKRISADYRINEFEPGRRLGFEVITGPARPTGRYELEAQGNATKVRFALDWHPKWWQVLLAPAVGRQMVQEIGALADLKRVLETPA